MRGVLLFALTIQFAGVASAQRATEIALRALLMSRERGPAVRAPQTDRDAFKDRVRRFACVMDVPPDLGLAIVEQESDFAPDAIGPMNELGAAQVLQSTGRQYSLDVQMLRTDPDYGIWAGFLILRDLLDRFPEPTAIMAYNGGPGVADLDRLPAEVRTKVERYRDQIERRRAKYARERNC